jgi:NADH-quinone oxidoreductase subunit F
LIDEIERRELQINVELKETGCHGFCERGPVVVIRPKRIFYQRVKPEDIPEIISETVLNGNIIERLLYVDPVTNEKIVYEADVPFYKRQTRNILGVNGEIDPTNIEDYIAIGGYSALSKVLFHMAPEEIIEEVKRSGLRGRSGGGFPAARKWESCRHAKGDIKYVICNASEGDPGVFKDRSILEGNPHCVLEGMIIGAYAIGANHGYLYVGKKYPLVLKNSFLALEQARQYGLLGDNILSSGFDFDIEITRGGGSYVGGESTALMAQLEGGIAEPRAKYTHTVEVGLWDRPTNLNNVETWANVPLIINKGADWYSQIGTAGSKGTKIFSLAGKINNTGLVEVPMGITLGEMIYDIGGGIPKNKKFKAVQIGGGSGGFIPQQLIDLPLEFEQLQAAGAPMGGGIIVMDDDNCMVDAARYFIEFLKGESCGKCVPCREGLTRMSEVLNRITKGKGKQKDLDTLEDLAGILSDGALCALGQTAANPVLSTLHYFRDEYIAHIDEKKCPASVCRELIQYSIDPEKCEGCLRCLRACPTGAISGEKRKAHTINQDMCIKCGACYDVCKFGAVIKR